MTKNATILKRIASMGESFRMHLARDCKKHSEAQCNGDYYFDDDANKWIGYDRVTFSHDSEAANVIAKHAKSVENNIIARILTMTRTKDIPPFISYAGDPRGFVIKINSDKLDEDEIKLCESLHFMRDWGGDYTIVKNDEV